MAKIFTHQSSEKKDYGLEATGSAGRDESGDAMAVGLVVQAGGVVHSPDKDEQGVLLDINNSFKVVFGNFMQVDLEDGETAVISNVGGQVKAQITCKKNGEIHLNGNSYSAVLYEKLEQFMNNFKAWANTHNHSAAGSPPSVGFTGSLDAKSEGVKLE